MHIVLCALLIFCAQASSLNDEKMDPMDPFLIISESLPTNSTDQENNRQYSFDLDKMCYVGNGHLAATVFGQNFYMNGAYNGRDGQSHRATIPNFQLFSMAGNFTHKQ